MKEVTNPKPDAEGIDSRSRLGLLGRPVAGLLVASLLIGCGGEGTGGQSSGSSPSPGSSSTRRPPGVPEATPQPTPEPSPDPWLPWSERLDARLGETGFTAESRAACAKTRPAKLETLTEPERALEKGPTYRTVQMVVAEVIGPEGPVADVPGLGEREWAGFARTYRGDAQVGGPEDIELLACIVLRTGGSAGYVRNGVAFTAYKTSEVIWMVDRATTERVGQHWVIGAAYAANREFPSTMIEGTIVADDLVLLPLGAAFGDPGEDAARTIVSFLGRVSPLAGVFEQLRAWQGNDALLLPVGLELFDPDGLPGQAMFGQTFVVRLVLLEPDRVAFAEAFCAPKGIITGEKLRTGSDLTLELGRFEASGSAVRIAGDFVYPFEASGTIQAVDADARACGIPDEGEWTASARPELRVMATADGYTLELAAP